MPTDLRRKLAPVAITLLAVALCAISSDAAGPARSVFGIMAGVVTDGEGTPQMGAAVALLAPDGRTLQQAYSNDRGIFMLERVLPGLYSLRITLASFLPVLKENILIEPGVRSFLSINMSSLFDTADLIRGKRRIPVSDDDWTWVLRSAGANRPVLRYVSADGPPSPPVQRASADFHTVLQFSGGGGRTTTAGSEADFNTSFAVANKTFPNTSLLLSGNVGYERQTPATAFRGSLRRQFANGSTPEVSVTLRQIFLPTAFFGRGGTSREDNMQSLTVAAGDRFQMAGSVRLEYGFLYDSISFLDRLNSFSPYGRVILETSPGSALQLYYTEGAPHPRQPGSDALGQAASDLAVFPRLSVRNGALAIQRGRHIEASFHRNFGKTTVAQAGVFRDQVSNLALNSSVQGDPLPDFLPDVFSQQHAFNSGDHQTMGVRAAVQHQLSESLQTTLAYTYSGALAPERYTLLSQRPDELRNILRMQKRHALAAKLAANVPVTGTRVFAAYKWVLGTAVSPVDMYDESFGQADPNLSIVIRQPLPAFVVLPGRVEALADFRNLLAQGYVPITTADGKRLLLVQNARSFRGGFSFVF